METICLGIKRSKTEIIGPHDMAIISDDEDWSNRRQIYATPQILLLGYTAHFAGVSRPSGKARKGKRPEN